MKSSLPFSALAFLAIALSAGAATFPYANDFSGTGSNTAFTNETADAEWALNGDAYRNNQTATSWTPTTASTSITGVAGNSFTLETQFTISSFGTFNGNGATLGMGLFSLSSNFVGTNTTNSYYLADWVYGHSSGTDVGRLRIIALGDTSGTTTPTYGFADDNAGANFAATQGTTYLLRLVGTYSESGSLSMTLGLFNAAGTTQIGTSASLTDSSPLTGEYFGYRNRIGIQGGTSTIDFDNFSVTSLAAVPEPATYALLGGLAALGLVVARRRR